MVRTTYKASGSCLCLGCRGNTIDRHLIALDLCFVECLIWDVHQYILIFVGNIALLECILDRLLDCI